MVDLLAVKTARTVVSTETATKVTALHLRCEADPGMCVSPCHGAQGRDTGPVLDVIGELAVCRGAGAWSRHLYSHDSLTPNAREDTAWGTKRGPLEGLRV